MAHYPSDGCLHGHHDELTGVPLCDTCFGEVHYVVDVWVHNMGPAFNRDHRATHSLLGEEGRTMVAALMHRREA